MAFFPSKAASITIAASARPYNTAKISGKCDLAPTDNFTGGGYQTNEAGFFSMDMSFSGPYDGTEGLAPGDSLAITFAVGGAGPTFAPTIRISQIDVDTANIRNSVSQISVQGTSNGTFTVSY